MYIWFFISLFGFIATLPLYFLSLEHLKLREKYGESKGKKIGDAYGVISGWGFFIFWFGIWFSPQTGFSIPIFQELIFRLPVFNITIPLIHLVVFTPFCSRCVVWNKRCNRDNIESSWNTQTFEDCYTGVYSILRHLQYLGGLLAHIGFSFLWSGLYCLLSTPLIAAVVYFISKKEEIELTKEFGQKYMDYKKNTPMLLPRL